MLKLLKKNKPNDGWKYGNVTKKDVFINIEF